MNVGTINGNSTTGMEITHKKVTKEDSQQEKGTASSVIQEDTVTISEEGRKKSESQQIQTDGRSSQNGDSSNAKSEEAQINVDDIKKDLQLKKSETKRKQKQLESLQQQAENDPSKQAELHKVKTKVAQLKKEEEKIKSQMYSV